MRDRVVESIQEIKRLKSLFLSPDPKIPKTLERWIKKLKDENKIEYKGSKRTGGYYVK
jgi:ATP-dependent DNA helicase RecG